MKFETTRFGKIEVTLNDIITLPDGPLGFPDCTRFTFVDEQKAKPFRVLQSLDHPAMAFVVVNPQLVKPDYHVDLTLKDLNQLGCAKITEDIVVYAILTMADIKDITVNLQGPIVINKKDKIGYQFVLAESGYTTREPLVLA